MSTSVYINFTLVFPEGGRGDLAKSAALQLAQLLTTLANEVDAGQSMLVVVQDGVLCTPDLKPQGAILEFARPD